MLSFITRCHTITGVLLLVSIQGTHACPYDVFAWTSLKSEPSDYYLNFPWENITTIGFFGSATDNIEMRDYIHSQGKKMVRGVAPTDACPGDELYNQTCVSMWVNAEVQKALEQDYDGISMDYEGHNPKYTEGYNAAAKQACESFHSMVPGSEVSVTVPIYPEYEGRNYDYSGIADSCDYLFIMAYDGEFWDNVQCAVQASVNCSMATSALSTDEFGVQRYIELGVDPSQLYLGLPWYGLKYEFIAGVPFFTGQLTYKEVQNAIQNAGDQGKLSFEERGQVWRLECGGPCVDGDRATEIWFDDPASLAPKYALSSKYGLKGVGMWEASHADYNTTQGLQQAQDMWAAVCAG